jgi:DinB superfamily
MCRGCFARDSRSAALDAGAGVLTRMRPQDAEYAPYFSRYIDLVSEADILPVLEAQTGLMQAIVARAGGKERFAYAPGKWTVREVAGHVADTERVFGFRVLVFGRGDANELPGFDENAYIEHARFDEIPLSDLVEEFALVRQANIRLLKGLADDAWSASGVANGRRITVRALAFLMAGHVRHHLAGLAANYGI